MKNSSLYFLFLLLALACNHVHKEYDKKSFPTYSWASGQEITFTPEITDTTKAHTLKLGIRHIFGTPIKSINVQVKVISPSGKESTNHYELVLVDNNNKYIGSCGGDLCDLEVLVEDNIRYNERGKYSYIISHNMRVSKVPGVMEFGIIIDEKD